VAELHEEQLLGQIIEHAPEIRA
jgi:hypothetical protein